MMKKYWSCGLFLLLSACDRPKDPLRDYTHGAVVEQVLIRDVTGRCYKLADVGVGTRRRLEIQPMQGVACDAAERRLP